MVLQMGIGDGGMEDNDIFNRCILEGVPLTRERVRLMYSPTSIWGTIYQGTGCCGQRRAGGMKSYSESNFLFPRDFILQKVRSMLIDRLA